ncbi:Arc family DNA-binding protein [Serratia fonticola]|uniref:Arc family DNA-binding protein n=1 Tax=Serratia fonticola TaxID=47917 RepID=UPI003B000D3C
MKQESPVSVRMTPALKALLKDLAEKDDRTLSREIVRRVKESLKRDGIAVPE